MELINKLIIEVAKKSKTLQILLIAACFVFGLTWIDKENLAAQAQLQDLLKDAYVQQSLCQDKLIKLSLDINRLEAEIHKLKHKE